MQKTESSRWGNFDGVKMLLFRKAFRIARPRGRRGEHRRIAHNAEIRWSAMLNVCSFEDEMSTGTLSIYVGK